jgi:hypothetical protein
LSAIGVQKSVDLNCCAPSTGGVQSPDRSRSVLTGEHAIGNQILSGIAPRAPSLEDHAAGTGNGDHKYLFQYSFLTVAPKGRPRKAGERVIRTTVDLPEKIWRAAKIRAMDERRDLRAIIIRAMQAYLKTKLKTGDA